MDFAECCKTTSALMSLPAGRFTVTAPPHFLRVNTIYEIVFEVSGMPRINNHIFLRMKRLVFVCLFISIYLFLIYHSAWHIGGNQ